MLIYLGRTALALTIAVLKETEKNETRVAASPDTVKKYIAAGAKVHIESGAGENADILDSRFTDAGAKICKTAAETLKSANIILKVAPPSEKEIESFPSGALLISQINPYQNEALIKSFAKNKIDAFAMELIPRISRAQSMDVLSSQSNLAGYKAVLDACEHYGHAMPMMMTAAGTVPPAKVFVMGAGVAGLQAIATARRLGASVSATDVRLATKEQVESLGAKFVFVDDDEAKQSETAGGYAKEMSAAYMKKQSALIAETISKQDIVITTALIPGRPAPVLITEDMVKTMKPGSIIVDLAASMGGNCPLTEADKVVHKHGITIIGQTNLAGHVAADSSALFSRNLLNFITLLYDKDKGEIDLTKDTEIVKAVTLLDNGKPAHDLMSTKPSSPKPAAKTTSKKKTTPKKTNTSVKTTTKAPVEKKQNTKKTASTEKKSAIKKTTTAKTKAKGK